MMSEDKLKTLLQRADRFAEGRRVSVCDNVADAVRKRLHYRHIKRIGISSVAAAVILVGVGVWAVAGYLSAKNSRQIAVLEQKVAELAAQSEASQKFVKELLRNEREHDRLMQLEMELASIPDPLVEMAFEDDKTAFVMVYQADRLYRELNLKDSAVETYNRVIELFGETRWAQVARERLSEIEKSKINNET
jgi:hypothetical protein